MFRSFLWFILLIIYISLLLPAMLIYLFIFLFQGRRKARMFCFRVSRFACLRALSVAGIKVYIHGTENLPDDNFFILAPNHQGSFDAVVTLLVLNRPYGFAAKKTLSFLPVVGLWFKLLGAVFVSRNKHTAANDIVNKCVNVLNRGEPLLIFPEGTRSKTGKINDIKTGVFRISELTGAPIVPVIINGTRTAWEEKTKITPCKIEVKIMPDVLNVSDTKHSTLVELKGKLRQIYENNL